MSSVSLINALAGTSSRNEKQQLLVDAFLSGERDFFVAAKLAYDPLVTFGVKKVSEILDEDDGEPGELLFEHVLDLASKLQTRKLTGHAARDAIIEACDKSGIAVWNTFYRRFLLKDFKCGTDASTINKALKEASKSDKSAEKYIIPIFSCQLAHDGARPKHEKKVSGKKLLDVKLDGVRFVAILDKSSGNVTMFTRNGKTNDNFPYIKEALVKLMEELPGSVALDGEIVSSSFQELMSQVNRKSDVDTSTARFALFDIIPLADFHRGVCSATQLQRHQVLADLEMTGLLKKHSGDLVYVIPKVMVDLDTPEGQDEFREFNKKALIAGYEGVMVKDPNAKYTTKRTFAWLKIKPFIEVTLKIVGAYEGEAGTKAEGMLGGFMMEGEDDDMFIKVDVGSGFTDAERIEFWNERDKWIGIMVEVRADAITKERNSDHYSLRFPRWKGRRGFIPGEKV